MKVLRQENVNEFAHKKIAGQVCDDNGNKIQAVLMCYLCGYGVVTV